MGPGQWAAMATVPSATPAPMGYLSSRLGLEAQDVQLGLPGLQHKGERQGGHHAGPERPDSAGDRQEDSNATTGRRKKPGNDPD
jgi:hypothetical protein